MRKLVLTVAVLALGCNLLKKKGDDADAAADAAIEAEATAVVDAGVTGPSSVTVTAKNIADVARFPAEVAVADDDAKLLQLTTVRSSPKGGTVVATLKAGTDPVKVADYQTSFLVTFPDPKDANTTLAGWISKDGFTAPMVLRDAGVKTDAGVVVVDAGPPAKLTCPAGQLAVVLATTPVCKKKCKVDADCKPGGAGACANANSQSGSVVRVCASE